MSPHTKSLDAHASILIVDDEQGIRSVLKRVLLQGGLGGPRLREAGSGEEALEILAKERVDLVLTDFRMRAKTGVDVLAWVHEHRPATKRVLMTGYNEESIAVDGINAGRVEAYVKKPWDNSQLLATLRDLLQEQRLHALREEAHANAMRRAVQADPIAKGSLRRL